MKKISECTHYTYVDRALAIGEYVYDSGSARVYRVETKRLSVAGQPRVQYLTAATRLPAPVKATIEILATLRRVAETGKNTVGSRGVTADDPGVAIPAGPTLGRWEWRLPDRDVLCDMPYLSLISPDYVVATTPNSDDSPTVRFVRDKKLLGRLGAMIAAQTCPAPLAERSVHEIDRTPPNPAPPPFDEPEPTEWLDRVDWARRKSAASHTPHSLHPDSDACRAAAKAILSPIATSTSRRETGTSYDGRTTYPGADFYYGPGWTVIIQDPK